MSMCVPAAAEVAVLDPLWADLRRQASEVLEAEAAVASLLWPAVLSRASFEEAVSHRVAGRLAGQALGFEAIQDAFSAALADDPAVAAGIRQDARAVLERDAATDRVLDVVANFKGFHALQAHRLSHWLWMSGRRDLALFLQSRASEVFAVDIHPAARLGSGVFLDHATGFVAGETVVIEDDVSLLQGVTLGGSGQARRDRHPKVRRGALIGAGAQILGPIEVGTCSRVAAGSVVLSDVPPCTTVAGVPARIVGTGGCADPARRMDQQLSQEAYAAFTYTI